MVAEPLALLEHSQLQLGASGSTPLAPGLSAVDWADFEGYISKLCDCPHVSAEADLYSQDAILALFKQLWYVGAWQRSQEAPGASELTPSAEEDATRTAGEGGDRALGPRAALSKANPQADQASSASMIARGPYQGPGDPATSEQLVSAPNLRQREAVSEDVHKTPPAEQMEPLPGAHNVEPAGEPRPCLSGDAGMACCSLNDQQLRSLTPISIFSKHAV